MAQVYHENLGLDAAVLFAKFLILIFNAWIWDARQMF